MYLTKTTILAGLQGNKRPFLLLNRPELVQSRQSTLAQSGIDVGKLARTAFAIRVR